MILSALTLAACGSAAQSSNGPALPGVEGARLFKAKGCTTCHTIGQGVKVGPDLQGLFSRREEAWVRRYIADPVTMVQEDPVAGQLKAQFKIQMPRMMISAPEMEQLIAYLREATLATKP